jgi:cytochrome b6-f complex iron-sulfur subunit
VRRRRRKVDPAVEALLHDQAIPEGRLEDDDDVAALRAAIELRASRLGADLPSDEMIEALRRRVAAGGLEDDMRRPLSRRALLTAGGAAVAAGVAGAVVDRALFSQGTSTPSHTAAAELVPDDGEWVHVATTEQLAGGAPQRFAASKVVGFVSEQNGTPVAVSGACTHLGCLLQANAQAGRLDCPCHRTAFSPEGNVLYSELSSQPASLPRMKTRRSDAGVEVFVPKEV